MSIDDTTYQSFTAREIADAINELGYRAKIVTDDDTTMIFSASSGIQWNAWLGTDDPFVRAIHLSTVIHTSENAYQWVNAWNSTHCWSMAHVMTDEDDDLNDSESRIMIAFSYDFSGGVSNRYLQVVIEHWIDSIDELYGYEGVRTISGRAMEAN